MRSVPEGIRITKVGLWYILFCVLVAIAATNTGNNALYMVLATMLALLVVSGVVSRQNVRRLAVTVEPPDQLFANTPATVGFELAHRGRLVPRWCLLLSLDAGGSPLFIPYLKPRTSTRGTIEVILPRRGHHQLAAAHVASLFPFGFFRKGTRYRLRTEVLVFPELFPAAGRSDSDSGQHGDEPSRRAGWGHDLLSLRAFQPGDDPRGIHWKQTARTGRMVFMEREAEDSRRLAILLDNGVKGGIHGTERGLPEDIARRFEQLVSEAATAAVDHLSRGYEVELVTRDRVLPFASGVRQRWALLEALALIAPCEPARRGLRSSDPRAAELRLALPSAATARRQAS